MFRVRGALGDAVDFLPEDEQLRGFVSSGQKHDPHAKAPRRARRKPTPMARQELNRVQQVVSLKAKRARLGQTLAKLRESQHGQEHDKEHSHVHWLPSNNLRQEPEYDAVETYRRDSDTAYEQGNFWEELCEGYVGEFHRRIVEGEKTGPRGRLFAQVGPSSNRQDCEGDRRLRQIEKYLYSSGYKLTLDQQTFARKYVDACLPLIYGKEWSSHSVRVMRERGIDKMMSDVMVICPRRFGKTFVVALFLAALCAVVPGITIAVFSTGRRASSNLTQNIEQFMRRFPGVEERIIKRNDEQIFLAAEGELGSQKAGSDAARKLQRAESTTRLYSFPAATDSKFTQLALINNGEAGVCVLVGERKREPKERERELKIQWSTPIIIQWDFTTPGTTLERTHGGAHVCIATDHTLVCLCTEIAHDEPAATPEHDRHKPVPEPRMQRRVVVPWERRVVGHDWIGSGESNEHANIASRCQDTRDLCLEVCT